LQAIHHTFLHYLIQWIADNAKTYGEWPAMDEHINSKEMRYANEKRAQKEEFKEKYPEHVIWYESDEIEDPVLEQYREVILNPLSQFIKESKENETDAVFKFFEKKEQYSKILNLFMQVKIKIDNEENFVVKPGDCAFGFGVMMC
jgi:hypothetical protein